MMSQTLRFIFDHFLDRRMEIQKIEYLEEEKRLLDEIKNIFHNFFKSYHLVKKKGKQRTQVFFV